MKNIYNYEIKEKFLKLQKSRKSYETIFRKTYRFELAEEKELYSFTFEELENMFYNFKIDNFSTIRTYKSYISSYLNWCCEMKYIFRNELDQIQNGDFSRYFPEKIKYLTYSELGNWQGSQLNLKDILISQLLFLGAETLELQNLRPKDFEEEKKVIWLMKYPRSGSMRRLDMDEQTVKIFKKVLEESEYSSLDFIITEEISGKIGSVEYLKKNFIRDSGAIHYAYTLGLGMKNEEISKIDRLIILSKFPEIAPSYLKELIKIENIRYTYIDRKNNSLLRVVEEDLDSEKAEEESYYKDGAIKYYHGKRYERNVLNRKKAIEIHGLTCFGCNFNFEEVYGERGKDFIEIHHIKLLSLMEKETTINPFEDLVPVCSNCHRMIHRKKSEVLSIDDLKKLINAKAKK